MSWPGSRRLARNFTLGEFFGYEHASARQLDALQRVVGLVLQPLRDAIGCPIYPTSWILWRNGTARTGAHATGGAVDFVAACRTPAELVAQLVAMFPDRAARWGELIDERDHVHVTAPGIGGNGEVWVEPTEGEYVAIGDTFPGGPGPDTRDPIDLPGIEVTVDRRAEAGSSILVGALLLGLALAR